MKPLLIVSMSTKSMMNDKKRSWKEQLDLCNKDETHSFLCFESFILIAEDQLFEHYLAPLLIVEELFLERRLFTFRDTRRDWGEFWTPRKIRKYFSKYFLIFWNIKVYFNLPMYKHLLEQEIVKESFLLSVQIILRFLFTHIIFHSAQIFRT